MTRPTDAGSIARNKELVRRSFAAIGTRDLGALAGLLTSDVRVRCAGGGGSDGVVTFDSFAALAYDIRHNLGELYDPTVGIEPEILSLTAEGLERGQLSEWILGAVQKMPAVGRMVTPGGPWGQSRS